MVEKIVNHTDKWNNYEIGNVPWIEKHRDHPCREYFVGLIKFNGIKSVLEIGGGECIEAVALKDRIEYTVADVSDTFLDNAKKLGVNTIKADMINLPSNKKYDLVHMSSVIEHSPDIVKTIENLKKVSDSYFITMFKWNWGSNLKSKFYEDRGYFSSMFGIDAVFELFGNIEEKVVITTQGKVISLNKARKANKEKRFYRNGDRLMFWGTW
jgi:hypothetical protein